MEQQPDIVIVNGTVHFDGNGGNHHYTFQNNDYTYICDIVVIGNNDSTSATLTVSRGDKNMITQKATLLLEDP